MGWLVWPCVVRNAGGGLQGYDFHHTNHTFPYCIAAGAWGVAVRTERELWSRAGLSRKGDAYDHQQYNDTGPTRPVSLVGPASLVTDVNLMFYVITNWSFWTLRNSSGRDRWIMVWGQAWTELQILCLNSSFSSRRKGNNHRPGQMRGWLRNSWKFSKNKFCWVQSGWIVLSQSASSKTRHLPYRTITSKKHWSSCFQYN